MNSGEDFFRELFREWHVCSIIPQCLRSRTKAMMKHKDKVHVEEQVKKLVKKKTMFKAKETQKML